MADPLYYFHDSNKSLGIDNSKWMSKLDDRLYVSQISIPGTHETMALHGVLDIGKCQVLILPDQLQAGIRYLDIRCKYVTDGTDAMSESFKIHHGSLDEKSTFGDVLNAVVAFLKQNPSETILIRVKQESSHESDNVFTKVMKSYKNQDKYKDYFWENSSLKSTTPRLKDVRGKIVVLYNIGDHSIGLPYPNALDIQDQYHLTTNWDLYEKWQGHVKKYLEIADTQFNNNQVNNTKIPDNKIILNHLSANIGSYPYFVASGHWYNGTFAGRLWTGLTTLTSKNTYPEFPRINCLGKLCSIYFEGMNTMCGSRLSNYKFSGIIAADFPGPDLINNVIQLNFDHQPPLLNYEPPSMKEINKTFENGDTIIWSMKNDEYTKNPEGVSLSVSGKGTLQFYKDNQVTKTISINPGALAISGYAETYKDYQLSIDFDEIRVNMTAGGSFRGNLYFIEPPWGKKPSSDTITISKRFQSPLAISTHIESPLTSAVYEVWYDSYATLAQGVLIQGQINLSQDPNIAQGAIEIGIVLYNNNSEVNFYNIHLSKDSKYTDNVIPILFAYNNTFDEIRVRITPVINQGDPTTTMEITLNGTIYYQPGQLPPQIFDIGVSNSAKKVVWKSQPGKLGSQLTYVGQKEPLGVGENPQVIIQCFKSKKLVNAIIETTHSFQRNRTPIHVPDGFDEVIIYGSNAWEVSGQCTLNDADSFTNHHIYSLQVASYSTTSYTTIWKSSKEMDVTGTSTVIILENMNSVQIYIECLKNGESVYKSDGIADKNATLNIVKEEIPNGFDEIRIVNPTATQTAIGESVVGSVECTQNTQAMQTPNTTIDNQQEHPKTLYPQNGDQPLDPQSGGKLPEPGQLAYGALITGTYQYTRKTRMAIYFFKNGQQVLIDDIVPHDHSGEFTFSKSYEIPDGFDNIQFSPFNRFNSGGNIQGEIYFGLGQTPRIDTTRSSSKAADLETQSNLEEVSALVRMLFTSDTHGELAKDATDYAIDQILLKIELLSDALFQQEKHKLLKYIKKAKHLSIQRNLLQHGSFENTEHWILSAHTGVRSNHELFKNTSLELQSTLEPMKYPTYAYQYIPKRKLRPYTRYLVRGFIAESSGLDLLLSCDSVRFKSRLDVLKENVLPISIDQGNCCTLADCIDVYEKNPDSHWFTYPIHTGSLQYNLDTGLELCFKLETENGVAQIGNIEIIEERVLTLKETKSIQRKETKWYKQQKAKDKKTQEKLDEAHQKIASLFNLDSSLRFEVTYQDIQDIQIPAAIALEGIYHSMLPDQPGPYYNDYSQLVALQRHARRLYKNRNLISSGTFQYDLQHWNIEGAATLETKNRDLFLHLLDWSAVASQSIRLDTVDENNKDIRYYLRVHAQGIGRVTLQHGGEIEILSFTTIDKQTRLMEWCPTTEQVELEITSDANKFMIYSIEIFKHLLE